MTQTLFDGKLAELIQQNISSEKNACLVAQPSVEEITAALNQLRALKAPGPNGMSAIFYQFHWSTMKDELIAMVPHFFRTDFLLKQLNHTLIVLLAKVDHPTKIEQYRSISLCNVACKVILKVFSSRLKWVLNKIISPYRAAFVPGRAIQENIIVGQEVLHSMKAKRGRKRLAALKLDMEKAYDRME